MKVSCQENKNYLLDIKNLITSIKEIHPLKDKVSKKWYFTVKKKIKKLQQVNGFNHFYFLFHYILYGFQDGHIQSSLTSQYHKLTPPTWAGILAEYHHQSKVLTVYQSHHSDVPVGSKITQINQMKPQKYINQILYSFGGVNDVPYFLQKNAIFSFIFFQHQNHSRAENISIKNKSLGKIVNINIKDRYQICGNYQEIIYHHLKKISNSFDLQKKFKLGFQKKKKTLYCQIPSFIFQNAKDNQKYQKMIQLINTQKEKYAKIILDIRNNFGGDVNTMAKLTHALMQVPKPTQITTYQKISPRIIETWEKEVIHKHVIPVFGKKSQIYQNEKKNLQLQKKLHKTGTSFLVTHNKMFQTLILLSDKKKHYTGKIEILINENCGSACLLLLDYLKDFKNVKICGSTSNVDTGNFNALTFHLPKTKTDFSMVTAYRDRQRKYNQYYDGNDRKIKII